MKILVYTCNQLKYLKTMLKTIHYLQTIIPIDLFIVDNYSADGTLIWLQEHPELNFIAFDEEKEKFSVVLNQTLDVFGIAEDLLIIRPNFMMMPDTIIGLQKFVNSLDDKPAIVGLYSNSFEYTQYINISAYSGTITFDDSMDLSYKKELGVNPNVLYLHRNIYEAVGQFDEQFGKAWECMEDFYLRTIKNDIPIIVPKAPIAIFDTDANRQTIDTEFLTDREHLKEKWNMNYFNMQPNCNIVETVVKDSIPNAKILEIGCDNAATLIEIKNILPDVKLYGVELNETAAEIASHFAEVYTGNIEENFHFDDIAFDYIIFGDVLEHLSDPQRILGICTEHLSPNGKIVASIPNLMHISVIADLLKGNFRYSDIGLLDKTHIHFFTYNEIIRMFQNVGLNHLDFRSVHDEKETERNNEIIDTLLKLEPSAERFMYTTFQYIVIAEV